LRVLVHGQVTIIFVVSACQFVYAEFFSAVFDPIWIDLSGCANCYVESGECTSVIGLQFALSSLFWRESNSLSNAHFVTSLNR